MSLAKENTNQNSNHKAIGILVIALTLLALCTPMLISVLNDNNTAANLQNNTATTTTATTASLNTCIDSANMAYNTQWKAADKDGDGQVLYSDGASSITTNYYEAIINCYQSNKVENSDSIIADYQQKRQQENDWYSAWLSSSSQVTSRKPISCVSNVIGSTAYTNCY